MENRKGGKNSKPEQVAPSHEGRQLEDVTKLEVMMLQHSTIDVHNEDPCITRNLLYLLILFPLRQQFSSISKCRFLGLTLKLLNQNLKVGLRNLHYGKMQGQMKIWTTHYKALVWGKNQTFGRFLPQTVKGLQKLCLKSCLSQLENTYTLTDSF